MRHKKFWCVLLALLLWIGGPVGAYATVSSLQSQKAQNEKELKNIQNRISSLESQKNTLSSEVSGLDDELTDTLLNIQVLEGDLELKQQEIEAAQIAYEEALEVEQRQYESMKLRIQYMYENQQSNGYLQSLLASESFADLVSRVDYAEELAEYDQRLLQAYAEAKQAVIDLQQRLDQEKAELLEIEAQLEEQKASLESVIAAKRAQIADFDSQLSSARAKAAEYQKKIRQQNDQIRKLQEEAAKAAASSSDSGNKKGSSSGTTATVSGGTGLGASIAAYGLRFVGNPYVFGGSSLTSGTDCSGFTMSVHANFGISIPRDSNAQASGGRAVSDAEKLPGDVVCYYGHVGIYIGNGQIVHASTPATGIKVSNMYYRSVRCIRRYW